MICEIHGIEMEWAPYHPAFAAYYKMEGQWICHLCEEELADEWEDPDNE